MGPCVGRSRKHLFFIITDSSGSSKYVREGILFCACVLGFLYVDGKGGKNYPDTEFVFSSI